MLRFLFLKTLAKSRGLFRKKLLLCNILSDVQSNRNYNNDSLRNILIVGVNAQILQTGF